MAELQQALDETLEVTYNLIRPCCAALELAMGCWGSCMTAMCSDVALHMRHRDFVHMARVALHEI